MGLFLCQGEHDHADVDLEALIRPITSTNSEDDVLLRAFFSHKSFGRNQNQVESQYPKTR